MKEKLQKSSGHPYFLPTDLVLNCNFAINKDRLLNLALPSTQDLAEFQIIMQVEIYDLTSSERVKRGVKRAWLIGETLALETGSGQKQPNIHRTKYKGVRFRPSRSRTKPWTAEVKPPMEKNKVWIDDCKHSGGSCPCI